MGDGRDFFGPRDDPRVGAQARGVQGGGVGGPRGGHWAAETTGFSLVGLK